MFILHRLFTLQGKVATVQTDTLYKNKTLDTISTKIERMDTAIDSINIRLAGICEKLQIQKK